MNEGSFDPDTKPQSKFRRLLHYTIDGAFDLAPPARHLTAFLTSGPRDWNLQGMFGAQTCGTRGR